MSAGIYSRGSTGQLDRYELRVQEVSISEPRDQFHPFGEIYRGDVRQKERHLQICLIVKKQHTIFEHGEVDKIVALEMGSILTKLDEDVVDVHIPVLITDDRID